MTAPDPRPGPLAAQLLIGQEPQPGLAPHCVTHLTSNPPYPGDACYQLDPASHSLTAPFQPQHKPGHLSGQGAGFGAQTIQAASRGGGNWGAHSHEMGHPDSSHGATPGTAANVSALLAALLGTTATGTGTGMGHPRQAGDMPQGAPDMDPTPQESADPPQQHHPAVESMATEQSQSEQQQQQRRQAKGHSQVPSQPQVMWSDPATLQVLQHLLQQSRPARPWAASQVQLVSMLVFGLKSMVFDNVHDRHR